MTSVDVEYSGSPPGMSGGAVFGVIVLVATIAVIGGFAYIKGRFMVFIVFHGPYYIDYTIWTIGYGIKNLKRISKQIKA